MPPGVAPMAGPPGMPPQRPPGPPGVPQQPQSQSGRAVSFSAIIESAKNHCQPDKHQLLNSLSERFRRNEVKKEQVVKELQGIVGVDLLKKIAAEVQHQQQPVQQAPPPGMPPQQTAQLMPPVHAMPNVAVSRPGMMQPPPAGNVQLSMLEELVAKFLNPQQKTTFMALTPKQRQDYCNRLMENNPQLRQMYQQRIAPPGQPLPTLPGPPPAANTAAGHLLGGGQPPQKMTHIQQAQATSMHLAQAKTEAHRAISPPPGAGPNAHPGMPMPHAPPPIIANPTAHRPVVNLPQPVPQGGFQVPPLAGQPAFQTPPLPGPPTGQSTSLKREASTPPDGSMAKKPRAVKEPPNAPRGSGGSSALSAAGFSPITTQLAQPAAKPAVARGVALEAVKNAASKAQSEGARDGPMAAPRAGGAWKAGGAKEPKAPREAKEKDPLREIDIIDSTGFNEQAEAEQLHADLATADGVPVNDQDLFFCDLPALTDHMRRTVGRIEGGPGSITSEAIQLMSHALEIFCSNLVGQLHDAARQRVDAEKDAAAKDARDAPAAKDAPLAPGIRVTSDVKKKVDAYRRKKAEEQQRREREEKERLAAEAAAKEADGKKKEKLPEDERLREQLKKKKEEEELKNRAESANKTALAAVGGVKIKKPRPPGAPSTAANLLSALRARIAAAANAPGGSPPSIPNAPPGVPDGGPSSSSPVPQLGGPEAPEGAAGGPSGAGAPGQLVALALAGAPAGFRRQVATTTAITLRDLLRTMERHPVLRKSRVLYRAYARLGEPKPGLSAPSP
eukprot:tig00020537_g10269.t1